MNRGADGRRPLLLAICGLDATHGVDYRSEHVLGVPGPRLREHLEHSCLEVPPFLLRIPRAEGRLGNHVQNGSDRWQLAPVDPIEPIAAPGARRVGWRWRHCR